MLVRLQNTGHRKYEHNQLASKAVLSDHVFDQETAHLIKEFGYIENKSLIRKNIRFI